VQPAAVHLTRQPILAVYRFVGWLLGVAIHWATSISHRPSDPGRNRVSKRRRLWAHSQSFSWANNHHLSSYYRPGEETWPFSPGGGASIIDPWLAQIVAPEKIAELLRGGTVSSELGPLSFNIGEIPKLSLSTAWTAWLASEYGLGNFRIGLPVDFEPADQFRLRTQLLQWRWKLTGIDLPDRLRRQVARELAKKYP